MPYAAAVVKKVGLVDRMRKRRCDVCNRSGPDIKVVAMFGGRRGAVEKYFLHENTCTTEQETYSAPNQDRADRAVTYYLDATGKKRMPGPRSFREAASAFQEATASQK